MTEVFLMKLPETIRIQANAKTREVHINGEWLNPIFSQKLRNHSPDGFNWGYGGSGPSQLALAILFKYLPAITAQSYYQDFNFAVIGGLKGGEDINQEIKLREVLRKISDLRREKNRIQ